MEIYASIEDSNTRKRYCFLALKAEAKDTHKFRLLNCLNKVAISGKILDPAETLCYVDPIVLIMSRIYNGIKSYWAKPETNEKKDEVSVLLVIALAIDDTQTFKE